jgi:polyhydroxybutyrate depolymerase
MTYRLAHELSNKVAAIAPVSGSMVYSSDNIPESPVSILHLHALNDNTVLYYGQFNPSQTVYPPVDSVLKKWSAFYMCNNKPDTIQTEADYIVKSWNCDNNKADLLLYVMQRGEHQWFTLQNSGIDATNLIWDFFKNHPKQTD